jgi:hypothetical protein
MLKRLVGLVAWYLGAVVLAIGIVAGISNLEYNLIAVLVVTPMLWIPLWTLSYFLGGSFWNPPHKVDE